MEATAEATVTEVDIKCEKCNGTGRFGLTGICFKCKGMGRITYTSTKNPSLGRIDPNAPKAVGVSAIVDTFAKARTNGVKTPKMHLGEFRFSRAGDRSANPGGIYVYKDDTVGTYLGKIVGGRLMMQRPFAHLEKEVLKVIANPAEEAIAYGRRTGNCSICSRTLTAEESIERTIGPVCASNYGL